MIIMWIAAALAGLWILITVIFWPHLWAPPKCPECGHHSLFCVDFWGSATNMHYRDVCWRCGAVVTGVC